MKTNSEKESVKTMKKSIAGKLTLRIALLLAVTLCILFICSYRIVSDIVLRDTESFMKSTISIYADLIVYESEGMHIPVSEALTDYIEYIGDYLCNWYRIDYAYMLIPEPEQNRIRIIGVSTEVGSDKAETAGFTSGNVLEHVFTDSEMKLLEGNEMYIVCKNDTFENGLDAVTVVKDFTDTRIFVGAGLSLDSIRRDIRHEFSYAALILIACFVGMTVLTEIIIRRKIRRPTKLISESMTAFVSDGQKNDIRIDVQGDDEFAAISSSFNRMADNIDTYLENIGTLSGERERRRAEVEIAANIQKGFLKPEKYDCIDYSISATMIPAKDIGGDLYDWAELDADRTLTVIADISGKGIPASLFMTVTLVLIRQMAKEGLSPSQILHSVNESLCSQNPGLLFATAFVGIYDRRDRSFTYSNAGHNVPYLLRNGRLSLLDGAEGIILGVFENQDYTEKSVTLGTGDTVFMYTDGVNEAQDRERRLFGTERLEQVLSGAGDDTVGSVMNAVRSFEDGADSADDITMLAFTVKFPLTLELAPYEEEFSKIREAILSTSLPRPEQLSLCVAAEECFVNICSYAFRETGKKDRTVLFEMDIGEKVTMRFTDGGIPFDPRNGVPDAGSYDPDEQTGGLGRLIAFTVADRVDYEYRDGKNILTLETTPHDSRPSP